MNIISIIQSWFDCVFAKPSEYDEIHFITRPEGYIDGDEDST
jgi:hypothetical protein